jgi:GNAT superfamily N-acetyltransferase
MPVTLRRATAADAALLASHRAGMFRDMGSIDPSMEDALRREASAYIERALGTGEYHAWIAMSADGTAIGGAGVQVRPMLPRPDTTGRRVLVGREALVLNVYVEPAWRRRGIARRLMEELLAWVRREHLARVLLHASADGRPLYESMGFVATNEMRYTGALDPEVRE